MSYDACPEDFWQILRLISRVRVGRELLEAFLPSFTAGRVRIEGYPADVLSKLREALGAGQPVGACFVTDGDRGTIYLDPHAPVGILAPFLVHEIVHALDPRVWSEAGAPRGGARALLSPRVEAVAFERQHAWTTQMRERDPAYDVFLRSRFAQARILNERLAGDEIASLYDPDFVA